MPGISVFLVLSMIIACWLLWLQRRSKAIPARRVPRMNIDSPRRVVQRKLAEGPAPEAKKSNDFYPPTEQRSPAVIVGETLPRVIVPTGRETVICYSRSACAAPVRIRVVKAQTSPHTPVPNLGESFTEFAWDGVPFDSNIVHRRRRRTFNKRTKAVVVSTRASRMREERGREHRIGVSVRRKLFP